MDAYFKVCDELCTIDDILANPAGVTLSEEPAIQYALMGLVSHHMDPSNIDTLMQFVERFEIDFQAFIMRVTLQKFPTIRATNTSVKQWFRTNAKELM
jgi:hypothetical protein